MTAGHDAAPLPLDDFERALIDAVAGTTPHADALRAQAARAAVVRRDRPADGRTTYLCVAADTPRLADGELSSRARFELDAGLSGVAELAVHNGWLDSLTMSAVGASWPEQPRLRGVVAEA